MHRTAPQSPGGWGWVACMQLLLGETKGCVTWQEHCGWLANMREDSELL
jgi:hypothetical protein